jgi:hypothetical protein
MNVIIVSLLPSGPQDIFSLLASVVETYDILRQSLHSHILRAFTIMNIWFQVLYVYHKDRSRAYYCK